MSQVQYSYSGEPFRIIRLQEMLGDGIANDRVQQNVFELCQLWSWKSLEVQLHYSKLL